MPAASAFPLTEAQEGLWYAQRIDPANPTYNTGQYFDLKGPLDVDAWRLAVNQALDEADALSVRIVDTGSGPMQELAERPRASLEVVDLRSQHDAEAAALARMSADMRKPLDPARDPLVSEVLLVVGDQRSFWYQRVHHVVIDGYGTQLLTERIAALYRERIGGQPARREPLGSLASIVEEDRAYRASAERERDRTFWRQMHDGAEDARALAEGLPVASHDVRSASVPLDASFEAVLLDVCRQSKVQWPDAMTALIAAYLARMTASDTAAVGVPAMLRLGSASVHVPAMVMNVLPVRLSIDEDVPLGEFLRSAARTLKEARKHGRYRGEQVRRDLGLVSQRHRLYSALVNILPFDRPLELPGIDATLHVLGTGPVEDLTVMVRAAGDGRGLSIDFDANPALYGEQLLQQHAARLAHFLSAAVAGASLGPVSILTSAEARWLETINDTAHDVPATTLTQLVEDALRRTPEAPALVDDTGTLSYAELDRRTAIVARKLIDAGIRSDDLVAVALPRSADLVVALIATLRAGGAYLPLDIDHPPARIAAILESARPRVALVSAATAGRLPADLPAISLDDNLYAAAADTRLDGRDEPRPGSAAYVIYTSGSTGVPKGVVIEHHAIVNRLEWMRSHYSFTPDDRIMQKTPATFDVSVWEFFLPWLAGAALVVAPPNAHRDPAWLASLIRRHDVTTMHFVPSMLSAFLDEPTARGLALRRVFCSGEALPAALRDRFHQTVTAELHNLYGPTEAAVDVTYWDASKGDDSAPVPIGWPVWNTRMYVLDRRLRALSAGVNGDLYIVGVQLAREYLGRPDLTADRFLPDPAVPGERMYKTGDIARRRDDGALLFLGRSDHQVKIRGLRIELEEIETVIRESGECAQAAVIARNDGAGPYLVAYLVPPPSGDTDVEAVRSKARSRLPDYMVPASFVIVPELPLTSSGKLNRNALPNPAPAARRSGPAPATDTERRVARIFAEILGGSPARDISSDDDFFELGGHSLMAAAVMRRVRDEWKSDLGLGVLFANPTVRQLARAINHERDDASEFAGDHGLGPLVKLRAGSGGAPLFCIHPAGGISWCYSRLARKLPPAHDVIGVQARGLDLACPLPSRLEDLAGDYVQLIREAYPSGPFNLLGWSIGGIIAHEMAVQLHASGEKVGFVALLDAYPSDRWRNMAEPAEGAALEALLYIAGEDPARFAKPLTRSSVIEFLRDRRHPLGELSDAALTGVVRVVESNNRLVRQFRHSRLDAPVLFFRAADHASDGLTPSEWAPYVSRSFEVHDIPATHAHLTGADAVEQMAPIVGAWLQGR